MIEQYWKTASGKEIAVGDMTPDHLRNVLRQLLREKRILPPYKLKNAMLAEIKVDVFNSDVDTRHQVEMSEKEAENWQNIPVDSYSDWLTYKGS